MVIGILLGYLTSYLFIDDVGGWRAMYGLAAGPALVVLAGMVRLHFPMCGSRAKQCPFGGTLCSLLPTLLASVRKMFHRGPFTIVAALQLPAASLHP